MVTLEPPPPGRRRRNGGRAGELAGSLLLGSVENGWGVRRHVEVLYHQRNSPVFDPLVVSRSVRVDKPLGILSVADGSDAIPPESGGLDQVEADGLRAPLPQIEVVLRGARTVREALDGEQDVRVVLGYDVAETLQNRKVLRAQFISIEVEVDGNVEANRRLQTLDGHVELPLQGGKPIRQAIQAGGQRGDLSSVPAVHPIVLCFELCFKCGDLRFEILPAHMRASGGQYREYKGEGRRDPAA